MSRFRSFCCVLYPDDESHLKILDYIVNYYEYAFILHDKDVYDSDEVDSDGITFHCKGDLKKPHYHVVIYFKNARSIDKLQSEIGLKHLESCNFYYYIRYLIHKDNPKKFQYSEDNISTNMELRVFNALKREYNFKEQDTRILIDYIRYKQKDGFCFLNDLYDFAVENDCLLDLKRNIHFYKLFLDNNQGYRRL